MKEIEFIGVHMIAAFLNFDHDTQDSVLMILNEVQKKRQAFRSKRNSDSVAAKTCTKTKRSEWTQKENDYIARWLAERDDVSYVASQVLKSFPTSRTYEAIKTQVYAIRRKMKRGEA